MTKSETIAENGRSSVHQDIALLSMYIQKKILFVRAFIEFATEYGLYRIFFMCCSRCVQPPGNVKPWWIAGCQFLHCSMFMFGHSRPQFVHCSPYLKTTTWTLQSVNHIRGIDFVILKIWCNITHIATVLTVSRIVKNRSTFYWKMTFSIILLINIEYFRCEC